MRPALVRKEKINQEIINQNEEIKNQNIELQLEKNTLSENLSSLKKEKLDLESSLTNLNNYKITQENNLEKDFNTKKEILNLKYDNLIKEVNKQYEDILRDSAFSASLDIDNLSSIINSLKYEMETLKSAVQSAQKEKLRVQEELQKSEFFKLQLSEEDLLEIKLIKSIEDKFRDSLPLNKIIWSGYYKAAFNSLKGRVLGSENKTGIYKLINDIDGKVYIGQAVNISNRWTDHIKAGLGAIAAPNNKLYASMKKVGPENFQFILLEECSQEQLNEKEKFWIEFYNSKILGLNETKGNVAQNGTNY